MAASPGQPALGIVLGLQYNSGPQVVMPACIIVTCMAMQLRIACWQSELLNDYGKIGDKFCLELSWAFCRVGGKQEQPISPCWRRQIRHKWQTLPAGDNSNFAS